MSDNEQDNRFDLTPYQAAGELEGLTKLVHEFYVNMDSLPEARGRENGDIVGFQKRELI